MALTVPQYVDRVYYAFSHGQPQSVAGVISAAIEADLPRALQRLANTTAANQAIAHLLQTSHSIVLASGVGTLPTTLLTSKEAQERYFVTLSGVTNPLQRLWSREDLVTPPFMADYYFYALSAAQIFVRKYDGTVPGGTLTPITLVGAFVPTIAQVVDELIDDLIDVGVALLLETTSQQATATAQSV